MSTYSCDGYIQVYTVHVHHDEPPCDVSTGMLDLKYQLAIGICLISMQAALVKFKQIRKH